MTHQPLLVLLAFLCLVAMAGYGAGESPIPEVKVVANVLDFGAKGDGKTDDSQAFLNAIEATHGPGVIFIPAGRYILKTQLVIKRSGIVLRGEAGHLTTLDFQTSLTDLFGNDWAGGLGTDQDVNHSSWKNAPGLIRFLGPEPHEADGWSLLTKVTHEADRHATKLKVDSVSLALNPKVSGGKLHNALVHRPLSWADDKMAGGSGDGALLRFHSRVSAVSSEDSTITLERNIPFQVILAAAPKLYRYMAGIENNGIERLVIHMKWERYHGHFMEAGWNGIEFSDASNCWARNISILNSDNAINFYRSSFCTVTDFHIGVTDTNGPNDIGCRLDINATGTRGPKNIECHHGINITASQDILARNFHLSVKCYHDLGVFNYTVGVVYANGTGLDLNMDHHRYYPYGTLWSNLMLGKGQEPLHPPYNAHIARKAGWYREDLPLGYKLTPNDLYSNMLS
eukprot:gene18183-24621_t